MHPTHGSNGTVCSIRKEQREFSRFFLCVDTETVRVLRLSSYMRFASQSLMAFRTTEDPTTILGSILLGLDPCSRSMFVRENTRKASIQ